MIKVANDERRIMWKRKTKEGHWQYGMRYYDAKEEKYRNIYTTLKRQSAKEAERILAKKIEERMGKEKKRSVSLSEAIESYLSEQKRLVKESTLKRNRFALQAVCSLLGANTRIDTLTAAHIRKKMLESGKSATMLNEYIKRFKAFFRWCYKTDLTDSDACVRKLEPFPDRSEREKIQDKYMTSDELEKVLDAMSVPYWYDLTLFLALSGLRIGEASALEASDIDLKNRVIHVTKTYSITTKEITSTKTLDSTRDVFVQDELLSLMIRLKKEAKKIDKKKLIFWNHTNFGRLNYAAYNKYLRDTTSHVLGRTLTVHALRHTHASLLAENGVPLDVISRRLGHSDSKITRDIYIHITERQREKDNASIEKIALIKSNKKAKKATNKVIRINDMR